jgi:1,4-alpha-glucan branching enzyme
VSLLRRSRDGGLVVAVLNFTPVPREGYRIGVPSAGAYNELVNSDAEVYGGTNMGNSGIVFAQPIAAHGFPQSLRLVLPPLSCLFLKPGQE